MNNELKAVAAKCRELADAIDAARTPEPPATGNDDGLDGWRAEVAGWKANVTIVDDFNGKSLQYRGLWWSEGGWGTDLSRGHTIMFPSETAALAALIAMPDDEPGSEKEVGCCSGCGSITGHAPGCPVWNRHPPASTPAAPAGDEWDEMAERMVGTDIDGCPGIHRHDGVPTKVARGGSCKGAMLAIHGDVKERKEIAISIIAAALRSAAATASKPAPPDADLRKRAEEAWDRWITDKNDGRSEREWATDFAATIRDEAIARAAEGQRARKWPEEKPGTTFGWFLVWHKGSYHWTPELWNQGGWSRGNGYFAPEMWCEMPPAPAATEGGGK